MRSPFFVWRRFEKRLYTNGVRGGRFWAGSFGCGQILLQIQHLGFWSRRFEKRLYTNKVRGGWFWAGSFGLWGDSCCRFNILVFGRDVLKNVFARTKFVEGGFGLEALGCGQILLQIQHLGFWSKRFEKRLYTNGVRGGHKKGKPSTQLG